MALLNNEHEQAVRMLAVLYVREQHESYIDYFRRSKMFAEWLLPENSGHLALHAHPSSYYRFDGYTIQQLSGIWRVDFSYCCWLLEWAQEEVAKHDPSNPQTSFAFEYPAPTLVSKEVPASKTISTFGGRFGRFDLR